MRPAIPVRPAFRLFAGAVLLGLAPLLAPTAARAQDSAIDCRSAVSATVATICASGYLAELQNRAAGEYRALAERIGQRPARGIAREQLALRDSCGADEICIERRLIAAIGTFRSAVPPPVEVTPLPDAFAPLDPLAPLPPPGTFPVGADGVLILPRVDVAPSGFLGDLSPEDRLAMTPPQVVVGTAMLLRPPPPLEAAFRDLAPERRQSVQVRLALAGLGGAPDGAWGPITEGALRDVAGQATALGRLVDLASPQGAAEFLRYIESPDFEADVLRGG